MIFHRWIDEKEDFYHLAGYEMANEVFSSDLIFFPFPSISSVVKWCLFFIFITSIKLLKKLLSGIQKSQSLLSLISICPTFCLLHLQHS